MFKSLYNKPTNDIVKELYQELIKKDQIIEELRAQIRELKHK